MKNYLQQTNNQSLQYIKELPRFINVIYSINNSYKYLFIYLNILLACASTCMYSSFIGQIIRERKMKEPKYEVGQQYLPKGKGCTLRTIIDIHTTYNLASEVVRLRYVSTHDFLGQKVIELDVCETTVSIGINLLNERNNK